MIDYTIAIYCFLDDYLQVSYPKEDKRRKQSNAEIITTALLSAQYFGGNYAKARLYMQEVHGMQSVNKSNFNRHLHRLKDVLINIFIAIGNTLKDFNTECRYLIDSFPIKVCKNIRISRCKLLQHEAYRGYNSSKKEYFYGFKVQVITTHDGIPVDFFIGAGSYHDITAFQSMNIDLPENSTLVGDSGYTDYKLEDLYAEHDKINLWVERKKNSKRPHSPAVNFLIKLWRKRIETTFSEINALLPTKIHAVTPQGFILKVTLFIIAYTCNRIY